MRRSPAFGRILGVLAMAAAMAGFGPAARSGAAPPGPLVIGVDHVDAANQDPAHGRLFEYTDFFSRSVTVQQGGVVDFRTAPGAFHVVALASNEPAARAAYPFAYPDAEDANTALGVPKIGFGPGILPIVHGNTNGDLSAVDFTKPNGPPDCGVAALGEPDCTFAGGTDIESAGPNLNFDQSGNPLPADWRVQITAAPGVYRYFCYIHPGMHGTLTVVGPTDNASTQQQIDEESAEQFADAQHDALVAERRANVVRFVGTRPGHRTYLFNVGIGADDNHVAIDEMFPNPQTVRGGPPRLHRGDSVRFTWRDTHNIHSVFFPAVPPNFGPDVGPIGFDCGSSYVAAGNGPPGCVEGAEGPEAIVDPGNAAAGTRLVSPSTVVDSGLLAGTAYGVTPSVQRFSVRTGRGTARGTYLFHCTLHDFMVGAFRVGG